MRLKFSLLWLGLLCAVSTDATAEVTLVRDGVAKCVIVLPKDSDEHEQAAARELSDHVAKISGVKLTSSPVAIDELEPLLAKLKSDGKVAVCLGRVALPKLQKAIESKGKLAGTFALRVDNEQVLIAGFEEGPIYGVCELLEQLGVRWFMPGDLGTVIPELKTVTLKEQETVQAPSFASRIFQMPDTDWQLRVRCGGLRFPGSHGLRGIPRFEKAPELYALVKGARRKSQQCLSNPKLLELVVANIREQRKKGHPPIFGMGPNDGGGFCQCEHCKALDGDDFDPFSNEPSVTDRYIWFFNQVLEKLSDYPDTKIAFYIYHSYMRPPVKQKPNPRIMGALAPIALDRVHGFSNPLSPEKNYAHKLYSDWGKILPELYDRGYWSNLACPGMPFIIVHRLRDEIPACHALGLKGWRVETFPNYGPKLPSMYVAARLMWNHKADVDAILRDFNEKFFGPAAEPMGNYITLMDAALRDSDHSTGCSWDMPYFYPAALRKKARTLLDQGRTLSEGKGVYAERVKMIVQTFDMLEAFIAMLETRARGDFDAAKAELEKVDANGNALMAYKPVPMLSAGRHSTFVNYMHRFYRPCTEQGYARTHDGNRLVAFANDEWDFLIDPQRVGEAVGYFRNELRGGNWQKIKSSSSSWSNQGLRYYKGLSWYRQDVNVPADFKDQRVFLWCGGVDEKAKVWLNGKLIGISPGASFYPFEMDATDAIRAGEPNKIVVCVANEKVDELGTGGIVAPVMLYAPRDGKNAKLENRRPLGETFP